MGVPRAALLLGVALIAARSPAQELRAEEITLRNVAEVRIGGPDAIGGLGDFYLANDLIELIVDHPSRRHAMLNHGGTIVDLVRRDRPDGDQFARLFPLVNLSQRVFVDYDAIRAELAPDGAWARVIVRSSGMRSLPRGDAVARALDVLVPDPEALADVTVETVYELRPGEPFVRLRTRLENTGDTPAPIFAFGDLWMRGGRSLRAFLGNAAAPELARGFHHRNFSASNILGSIEALAPFSHVVMAGLPAYPPIAYALYSPERSARELSFFGVSGEHVNLAVSFLDDPGWQELSTLRLLDAVRASLAAGARWEIERRLLVTGHADVGSATDVILPALQATDGRSGIGGSTTPPSVRTIVHVDDPLGHPVTQLLAERGEYRALLPPGTYRLTFRAEHRPDVVREVRVEAETLTPVDAVRWPDLGSVRLDPPFSDGGPGRVVFLGLDPTPDPVFGAELLDFTLDGRSMPSATETNAFSFVGGDVDPVEIALPVGRYRLVGTRGLEFDADVREVEIREGGAPVEVPPFELTRIAALPDHISADFHVHAQASEDSGTTNVSRLRDFVAVGIDLLVATDHDDVPDYDDAITRLGLIGQIRVLRGVELTCSTPNDEAPYTIGHNNAWPIAYQPWTHRRGSPPSQRLSAGELYSLLRREYHAEVVQVNHPRGKRPGVQEGNFFTHQGTAGFPADPSLPLSAPENAALLAPAADGTRPIDFDVIEVMNGKSRSQYLETRDDFHWLLRQGHRRAATANTDTHGPDGLAGLPRNYVRVGEEFRDTRVLHEAVRSGRSFGTNGPLFTRFRVGDGQAGDTVAASGGKVMVDYEVVAAPWVPRGEVRLVVNGEVVRVLHDASGRFDLPLSRDAFVTLEAGAPLEVDPATWIARHPGLYTEAIAPGFVPAAFTNPIFIDVDGDGRWTPPGLPSKGRPLSPLLTRGAVGVCLVGGIAVWRRRARGSRA